MAKIVRRISLHLMRQGLGSAWIAEWYHTQLWILVDCAMPWAVSLSLGDDKLFFVPKHNLYAFFMILIWLFD